MVAINSDSTAADGVFDSSDILNASVSSLTHNFHPCKYYEMDSLSSLSFNSSSISIIHMNIRSLQKILILCKNFCVCMPKIICLSESRINQKPLINLELPNYKLVHIDSPTPAGGVAVYVSNELRIEIVSNLSLNIDGCENMWIKLCHLDIILGVIYRHPKSNVKLFVDELNKTSEQLKTTKVYLIGDININIFSINNAKYASEYSNMLASNGYFPNQDICVLWLTIDLITERKMSTIHSYRRK